MWPSFQVRIGVAAILLLGALVVNVALTMVNARELVRDVSWVVHSQQVRAGLADLLRLADDAETGQRGYLITGDPKYLAPYSAASDELKNKAVQVASWVNDNPRQTARMTDLQKAITTRTFELKAVLDIRNASGLEAARRRILEGNGKKAMDTIRSVVGQMDHEEKVLLDERTLKAQTAAQYAKTTGLVSGIVAIIAILGFFRVLLSQVGERIRSAKIIEEQAERLQITLQSIGDAVLTTNEHGFVTSLNNVAERLTGWKQKDAVGLPLEQVFVIISESTREPVENPATVALRTGAIVGLANHTILIAKDGNEIPIDDSAAPIQGKQGVSGVVLVFRDVTDRRRQEKILEKSESELTDFFENANVGVFWTGPDGTILRANRSQLELLGYSHDEYVGRHVSDFHVDQTVIKDILGRLDKGEVIHNEPASLKCKDGALKEVLLSCNVHRENGKIVHSSCFTLDVTERNRAERALRESDSNLRLALESGRMGSWEWQVGTDTVTWTSGLEIIYGYAPGTFPGTFEAYQSRIHPDDRLEVKETIDRALTTGCDYWTEHRIKLEDGAVRWVSGRGMVIKDDQGEPVRMIGVATDITDRKKAEQDSRFLSEASVSLAGLVDYKSTLETVAKLSVPRFADWCTVDMLEEDGSIKRLVVVHTDPSQVEMIRELQERYRATERSERVVETVIRSGKPVMVEEVSDDMITAELTDPDLINIIRGLGLRSYIVVPLAIQGRVLGAMSFVTAESGRRYDMEDLKFVEDLAQRAATAIENARLYHEARQADSRKDEFLATLAHELRNPLASMTLAMEVLRIKEIGQDRLDEARSIIDRQLLHLVRLVDDLLDLSRITRDRLELRKTRVDLREVIQQAVEIAKPLAESKNHHLRVEVPDSPITVEADPTRLAQVFSNLLNNASKFTPVGGHVSLTVGCTAETVRLAVKDDGIGLTQEALPRIFDMFTQVDGTLEQTHGGLGIGLTLARRLVELHGGTISATSAGPGKGSEFTVELPLCLEHKSENTGEDVMTTEEKPLRKGLRVLVVDDNADSASMLSAMLEIEGHEAHVRYDGLAAVQAAETLEPDVVFMDIGLPGLNGFEAAERIRTNPANSGMTLVAITGWGQDQDRQRSKDAGFNVHLVKPVPIKSLKELLADISPRDRG